MFNYVMTSTYREDLGAAVELLKKGVDVHALKARFDYSRVMANRANRIFNKLNTK